MHLSLLIRFPRDWEFAFHTLTVKETLVLLLCLSGQEVSGATHHQQSFSREVGQLEQRCFASTRTLYPSVFVPGVPSAFLLQSRVPGLPCFLGVDHVPTRPTADPPVSPSDGRSDSRLTPTRPPARHACLSARLYVHVCPSRRPTVRASARPNYTSQETNSN